MQEVITPPEHQVRFQQEEKGRAMVIIALIGNHLSVYKGFCVYSLTSFNQWTLVKIGVTIKVLVLVQGKVGNLVIPM